jgi:probable F420-dependent oxidoreductase
MSNVTYGLAFVGGGPMAQPDMAADLAQAAEELGFTALWMPEHVVLPLDMQSRYPYSPDGKLPAAGFTTDSPDPFLWLTYVAAKTHSIRLCTGVLVLPQRDPLVVAKQAATLDVLSGGRATLGVGVGWLAEEFAALHADFTNRGRRMDEHIAVLRTLWGEQPATFHGTYTDFERCISMPRPLQPGGIPIVIGGDSARAARRAGALADGWFPGMPDQVALGPLVDLMRSTATAAGRDPDALALSTAYTGNEATRVALVELGFTHFTLGVPAHKIVGPGALDAALTALAGRVGLR